MPSFGLAGLTRRERSDHGKRRSLPPALLELVEGFALQKPPLPVAAIHREVCRIAQANEHALPSYHSIYRAINALPAALKTLADACKNDIAHLSPLIWRYLNFLGRYDFSLPDTIMNGGLRPLRNPTSAWDF